jgi:hypothetical protein
MMARSKKLNTAENPVPPIVEEMAAEADKQLEALEQQAQDAETAKAEATPEPQPVETPAETQPQEPPKEEAEPQPEPEPSKVERAEYDKLASELKRLRQEQQSWLGRQQKEITAAKLEDRLAALKKEWQEEYAKAQETQQPQVPAHLAHLSEEEREAYRNEPLPVEARMAQGVVSATERRLLAKIERLEKQHAEEMEAIRDARQKTETKSNEDKVWAAVNELRVRQGLPPNAHLFDTQPEVQGWLQEIDPDNPLGLTRAQVGGVHLEAGDARSLHQMILDCENQSVPTPQGEEAVTPEVQAQVKPSAVRARTAPKTTQKPKLEATAIRRFYQSTLNPNGTPVDLAGKPIIGTPSEVRKRVAEIEVEIEREADAGNVRGGLDGNLSVFARS